MATKARRRRPRGVRLPAASLVLPIVAILAGLGLLARIGLFFVHSSSEGNHLLAVAGTSLRTSTGCSATTSFPPMGSLTPVAVLSAPRIGLRAPVVNGSSNKQLDAAVGKVPTSHWPGAGALTVLAAHDVSWFSHIDRLKAGDVVDYQTPCLTYEYRVSLSQIASSTAPIYNHGRDELLLDTCYPLDALFYTSKRYLVYADLASVIRNGNTTVPTRTASYDIDAPADLRATGLTLRTNAAPLGHLTLTGQPAATWAQSNQPLDAEEAALALLFATLRSEQRGRTDWWAHLVRGGTLPFSSGAVLQGASTLTLTKRIQPALVVDGSTLQKVELSTEVLVLGTKHPGYYKLTLTGLAHDRLLTLDGLDLTLVKPERAQEASPSPSTAGSATPHAASMATPHPTPSAARSAPSSPAQSQTPEPSTSPSHSPEPAPSAS